MTLDHLALATTDQEAALRFFQRYFGFGLSYVAEDGTLMLRDRHGFLLALGRVDEPPVLPDFLHFGFSRASAEEVREFAARARSDGLEIVEESDEERYVSVKVRGPDGYVVEVSWETN